MADLDAIRRDNPLPEVAGNIIALKPAGPEWMACCPFHADRSPSFTILDSGHRFHCFGCGASGDALDFVQRAYGVTLPEAARMLGAGDVPKLEISRHWQIPDTSKRQDYGKAALAIWQRAQPAVGTLAEAYLRFRGILPTYPPDVRFLALPCDDFGPMPCLVLAVRNVGAEVTGIQRIWLASDGMGKADVPKPKRSLGHVKGGAIRLGDLGTSKTLTVCEGPEDGLSLMALFGRPVWASGGTSFLPAMQFPPNVQSVVIGADNDPAGRDAAQRAAHAFAQRGLTVRIIRPIEPFKDFNDELRGGQP
ncbi:hypothetical protein IP81_11435 [Novosphingobium sp. AAP83]|uniref:DUF7146 domain-containing protein n=1 Tax=Novosphingobium sp. AAP83 TaxID=1523425 RepID=UPI0006B9066C|nr:CHC2 zinc finger domain-containing protein [Novosphingobium sp. AAP83]KPF91318.1 hypothetical protein IP81_11435 [Novosphingobium sp. AAP83]